MVVFTSNPSPLEIRLAQHARIAGVRIDAGLARELAEIARAHICAEVCDASPGDHETALGAAGAQTAPQTYSQFTRPVAVTS